MDESLKLSHTRKSDYIKIDKLIEKTLSTIDTRTFCNFSTREVWEAAAKETDYFEPVTLEDIYLHKLAVLSNFIVYVYDKTVKGGIAGIEV